MFTKGKMEFGFYFYQMINNFDVFLFGIAFAVIGYRYLLNTRIRDQLNFY